MQKFKTVDELVSQLKPVKPVYCIRKKSIQIASKIFQKKFPGKILYAVKTNPHPEVLKTILQSGIEDFDVASIKEIEDIKKIIPKAKCSYMHTLKTNDLVHIHSDLEKLGGKIDKIYWVLLATVGAVVLQLVNIVV